VDFSGSAATWAKTLLFMTFSSTAIVLAMDALVTREVNGTLCGLARGGLFSPRMQTNQAGSKNLADFAKPLGGSHQVGVEGVGHGKRH
jgi:hypothetical protein